jgi:hypothetical protein
MGYVLVVSNLTWDSKSKRKRSFVLTYVSGMQCRKKTRSRSVMAYGSGLQYPKKTPRSPPKRPKTRTDRILVKARAFTMPLALAANRSFSIRVFDRSIAAMAHTYSQSTLCRLQQHLSQTSKTPVLPQYSSFTNTNRIPWLKKALSSW